MRLRIALAAEELRSASQFYLPVKLWGQGSHIVLIDHISEVLLEDGDLRVRGGGRCRFEAAGRLCMSAVSSFQLRFERQAFLPSPDGPLVRALVDSMSLRGATSNQVVPSQPGPGSQLALLLRPLFARNEAHAHLLDVHGGELIPHWSRLELLFDAKPSETRMRAATDVRSSSTDEHLGSTRYRVTDLPKEKLGRPR